MVSTTLSMRLLETLTLGAAIPIPMGLHLSTPLPTLGTFSIAVSVSAQEKPYVSHMRRIAEGRCGGDCSSLGKPVGDERQGQLLSTHLRRQSSGGMRSCPRKLPSQQARGGGREPNGAWAPSRG